MYTLISEIVKRKEREMIGLDRLMEIEGVVAAGQFSEDGHVIRQVGEMPEDLMESADLCVRQNQASRDFLDSLNEKLPRDYGSLVGWTIWGSKYSVVVVGNTRVFVKTSRGDYNQLMIDLAGSEATGPRPSNY
jgi:roadblock/LC7 domain-containing protein